MSNRTDKALRILSAAGVHLPAIVPGVGKGGFYIFSGLCVLGHGETIDAALEDAKRSGAVPDYAPLPAFRYEGKNVLRSGEVVAVCTSMTLAHRIANALNNYNANERGF